METDSGISISYGLDIKSRDEARKLAKRFATFYTGKKIFGTKVPAFKHYSDDNPGEQWTAEACKKSGNSVRIEYFAQYQMMGVMVTITDKCPVKCESNATEKECSGTKGCVWVEEGTKPACFQGG